jgi:hypothetical protein
MGEDINDKDAKVEGATKDWAWRLCSLAFNSAFSADSSAITTLCPGKVAPLFLKFFGLVHLLERCALPGRGCGGRG